MISVIIPAHNEEAVIAESLRALCGRPSPAEPLEIIVVCNGCTDQTHAAATSLTEELRRAGASLRVINSPVPSKVKAVNLGFAEAAGDVVVCMDADICLAGDGVHGLAEVLGRDGVLAAAPRAEMDYGDGPARASWMVRGYYKLWFSLPYVSEGMMGCGVYALNRAGRARLGEIPEIIADDGYVRASFAPRERVRADRVVATVRAPRTLRDLVKIKTRSRLGGYQLNARFGGKLPGQNERSQHRSAWLGLLGAPSLWWCIPPYIYVNIVSRRRARAQLAKLETYVWERDESTRGKSVRTKETTA